VTRCTRITQKGVAWLTDLGSLARTHVPQDIPDTVTKVSLARTHVPQDIPDDVTSDAANQPSLDISADEDTPVRIANVAGSFGSRACDPCVSLKTQCNLELPCARCSRRSTDCCYTIEKKDMKIVHPRKSCYSCRTKKYKCDLQEPCGKCTNRREPLVCEYPPPPTSSSTAPSGRSPQERNLISWRTE
jgi:hypothetical protein